MSKKINVEVTINSPISKVWENWNSPAAINTWNHASDDWECVEAQVDLQKGGTFSSTMRAKDGSGGFDFGGTYNNVIDQEYIEYTMFGEDKRKVTIDFVSMGTTTLMTIEFDAETVNSLDLQKQGWQAILVNFKNYCEMK
jgi:uncharacterized protein YndB with AHSA1/START domain